MILIKAILQDLLVKCTLYVHFSKQIFYKLIVHWEETISWEYEDFGVVGMTESAITFLVLPESG